MSDISKTTNVTKLTEALLIMSFRVLKVSLPHFLHDFWRKMFILLYSVNWINFIVWFPLRREILGDMCIVIVCELGCDVLNLESKAWSISWEQRVLLKWKKNIFINFQWLSLAKNCLRPETTPVTKLTINRGLLFNFTKNLKDRHFMGHSITGLKFSITIDF